MTYFIIASALLVALFIIRISLGNQSGRTKLEFGYATTSGKRQVNTDRIDWAYYDDETLLVVADGIGVGDKAVSAADIAAHIVSRVFEQTGSGENPAYFFMNAFRGVNSTILRYIPDGSAGASLLAVIIREDKLYYALAGNCKVSVFRGDELYDLSEGQTFDVLARRAFARKEINRLDTLEAIQESRIYNFLGKDGFRELEMFDTPLTLRRGDIILIMSDGVHEFCSDDRLISCLKSSGSCREIAEDIISKLDRSSNSEQDNASIITARINGI